MVSCWGTNCSTSNIQNKNLVFSGYWVPQISNSDFSASIITGQTRAKSYLFVKSKQVFTFFFHSYTPTKSVTDSVKEPMKKARKVQKEVERPWTKEHKSPDRNVEVSKVMHSFQKSFETTCSNSEEQQTTMSADKHYCIGLAIKCIFVRHCIETILFDLEFGSMLSATPS